MARLMSAITLWAADKTIQLTGQRRHLHKGPAVAPAFVPLTLAAQISFGPTALAASIARTATLRNAPPELLAHWRHSALSEAVILLEDGPTFELSKLLTSLADSERTHFASRVGAGVTDLYMNALGYAWRDNAAGLASSLDPHGDFLYAGGPADGHGVVLAEARGSFAAKVSDAAMAREAERKYLRQVRPFIGATSAHGTIIHGYAVAVGSQPGTPGAFLRLSQTHRAKTKSGTAPLPSARASALPVPAGIALATQRSNFILMGALPIAKWIDWLGGTRDLPEDAEPVPFVRFNYAGRSFLASLEAPAPFKTPYFPWDALDDYPFWLRHWDRYWRSDPWPLQWFVIEENAGIAFLNALTAMIRIGPRRDFAPLELPTGDVAGFAPAASDVRGLVRREDYDYALFRDGLALIAGPPPRKLTGFLRWMPKEGMLP